VKVFFSLEYLLKLSWALLHRNMEQI
jgi:hypothetical protein